MPLLIPIRHRLRLEADLGATKLKVRFVLPPQPVDATHWLNLSAGVSNCNVFLGRSFMRAARKSLASLTIDCFPLHFL